MKKKFFAGLIMMMIIHSMISASYAQSTLNVKAFIESYFDSVQLDMVPIVDPITSPLLFDTITIELHDPIFGHVVFSAKKVFDIYGNGSVTVPAPLFNNSYYLVLKHRNSIQTFSNAPILISNIVNYNFTTSVNMAFGNNLKLLNTAACIYSGDLNQDSIVNMIDINIWAIDNANFVNGYYLIDDMNGDLNVDASDFPVIDINNTLGIHVISPIFAFANELKGKAKFDIRPNPAKQNFIFNLQNDEKGILSILKMDGTLERNIAINQKTTNINIGDCPAGMYILRYTSGNKVLSQKLVVEH